jgi:hypothetical protein
MERYTALHTEAVDDGRLTYEEKPPSSPAGPD